MVRNCENNTNIKTKNTEKKVKEKFMPSIVKGERYKNAELLSKKADKVAKIEDAVL